MSFGLVCTNATFSSRKLIFGMEYVDSENLNKWRETEEGELIET